MQQGDARLNMFHSVFFDLDGTLSNTIILTMEALKQAAPSYGLPVPSEDTVKRATGFANPEFYRILFSGFPRDTVETAGPLIEEGELRALPAFKDKLLFEGCRKLLLNLKEKGLRLCIASTGGSEYVHAILDQTGIAALFDTVSCGQPDKTEMLKELIGNSKKDGCIMVGDMKKDYEAARNNGILSVGACYGYCRREISYFDLYIDEPFQLLDIIEKARFSKLN